MKPFIIISLFALNPLLVWAQNNEFTKDSIREVKDEIKNAKEYEKEEQKRASSFFSYFYHPENHTKYNGIITIGKDNNIKFVQFDSLRIYLPYDSTVYQKIFTEGILSPQIIYCAMDSLCNLPLPSYTIKDTFGVVQKPKYWELHSLIIESCEEIKHLRHKSTQRRFLLLVTPMSVITGMDAFLLEITNDTADSNTDLKTFLQKGAQVTFLKFVWGEI